MPVGAGRSSAPTAPRPTRPRPRSTPPRTPPPPPPPPPPPRPPRSPVPNSGPPPGQAHPRDKLAALLWADAAAPRARHSLRQALLTIRQTFPGDPPLLLERGDTVALNPAAGAVDAETLEGRLKTGSA